MFPLRMVSCVVCVALNVHSSLQKWLATQWKTMSALSLLCDNLAKDTKVPSHSARSPTCCHFLGILHTRKRPQSFLKLLKWLPQNVWLMLLLKCIISCGHSSPNGWVSLISVDTGKVSDVLSSKCRACELRRKLITSSQEYLKWKADCTNCHANHGGTAGTMEAVSLCRMFERSETTRELKCVHF